MKQTANKRIWAFLLAILMLLGTVPISALAEAEYTPDQYRISSFLSLGSSATQYIPLGASTSELNLPDYLDVTLTDGGSDYTGRISVDSWSSSDFESDRIGSYHFEPSLSEPWVRLPGVSLPVITVFVYDPDGAMTSEKYRLELEYTTSPPWNLNSDATELLGILGTVVPDAQLVQSMWPTTGTTLPQPNVSPTRDEAELRSALNIINSYFQESVAQPAAAAFWSANVEENRWLSEFWEVQYTYQVIDDVVSVTRIDFEPDYTGVSAAALALPTNGIVPVAGAVVTVAVDASKLTGYVSGSDSDMATLATGLGLSYTLNPRPIVYGSFTKITDNDTQIGGAPPANSGSAIYALQQIATAYSGSDAYADITTYLHNGSYPQLYWLFNLEPTSGTIPWRNSLPAMTVTGWGGGLSLNLDRITYPNGLQLEDMNLSLDTIAGSGDVILDNVNVTSPLTLASGKKLELRNGAELASLQVSNPASTLTVSDGTSTITSVDSASAPIRLVLNDTLQILGQFPAESITGTGTLWYAGARTGDVKDYGFLDFSRSNAGNNSYITGGPITLNFTADDFNPSLLSDPTDFGPLIQMPTTNTLDETQVQLASTFDTYTLEHMAPGTYETLFDSNGNPIQSGIVTLTNGIYTLDTGLFNVTGSGGYSKNFSKYNQVYNAIRNNDVSGNIVVTLNDNYDQVATAFLRSPGSGTSVRFRSKTGESFRFKPRSLTVIGDCPVTIENLDMSDVDVIFTESSELTLEGPVTLSALEASDPMRPMTVSGSVSVNGLVSYLGDITVNGGSLDIAGDLDAEGTLTVNSGDDVTVAGAVYANHISLNGAVLSAASIGGTGGSSALDTFTIHASSDVQSGGSITADTIDLDNTSEITFSGGIIRMNNFPTSGGTIHYNGSTNDSTALINLSGMSSLATDLGAFTLNVPQGFTAAKGDKIVQFNTGDAGHSGIPGQISLGGALINYILTQNGNFYELNEANVLVRADNGSGSQGFTTFAEAVAFSETNGAPWLGNNVARTIHLTASDTADPAQNQMPLYQQTTVTAAQGITLTVTGNYAVPGNENITFSGIEVIAAGHSIGSTGNGALAFNNSTLTAANISGTGSFAATGSDITLSGNVNTSGGLTFTDGSLTANDIITSGVASLSGVTLTANSIQGNASAAVTLTGVDSQNASMDIIGAGGATLNIDHATGAPLTLNDIAGFGNVNLYAQSQLAPRQIRMPVGSTLHAAGQSVIHVSTATGSVADAVIVLQGTAADALTGDPTFAMASGAFWMPASGDLLIVAGDTGGNRVTGTPRLSGALDDAFVLIRNSGGDYALSKKAEYMEVNTTVDGTPQELYQYGHANPNSTTATYGEPVDLAIRIYDKEGDPVKTDVGSGSSIKVQIGSSTTNTLDFDAATYFQTNAFVITDLLAEFAAAGKPIPYGTYPVTVFYYEDGAGYSSLSIDFTLELEGIALTAAFHPNIGLGTSGIPLSPASREYDGTTRVDASGTVVSDWDWLVFTDPNGVDHPLTALLNEDPTISLTATFEFADKDVGDDKLAKLTTLRMTSAIYSLANERSAPDASNVTSLYETSNPSDASITPAVITAFNSAITKPYDGTRTVSLSAASLGLVFPANIDPLSEMVTVDTSSILEYAHANVGADIAITTGTLILTGPDAKNYKIRDVDGDTTFVSGQNRFDLTLFDPSNPLFTGDITAIPITVDPTALESVLTLSYGYSKDYDATPDFTDQATIAALNADLKANPTILTGVLSVDFNDVYLEIVSIKFADGPGGTHSVPDAGDPHEYTMEFVLKLEGSARSNYDFMGDPDAYAHNIDGIGTIRPLEVELLWNTPTYPVLPDATSGSVTLSQSQINFSPPLWSDVTWSDDYIFDVVTTTPHDFIDDAVFTTPGDPDHPTLEYDLLPLTEGAETYLEFELKLDSSNYVNALTGGSTFGLGASFLVVPENTLLLTMEDQSETYQGAAWAGDKFRPIYRDQNGNLIDLGNTPVTVAVSSQTPGDSVSALTDIIDAGGYNVSVSFDGGTIITVPGIVDSSGNLLPIMLLNPTYGITIHQAAIALSVGPRIPTDLVWHAGLITHYTDITAFEYAGLKNRDKETDPVTLLPYEYPSQEMRDEMAQLPSVTLTFDPALDGEDGVNGVWEFDPPTPYESRNYILTPVSPAQAVEINRVSLEDDQLMVRFDAILQGVNQTNLEKGVYPYTNPSDGDYGWFASDSNSVVKVSLSYGFSGYPGFNTMELRDDLGNVSTFPGATPSGSVAMGTNSHSAGSDPADLTNSSRVTVKFNDGAYDSREYEIYYRVDNTSPDITIDPNDIVYDPQVGVKAWIPVTATDAESGIRAVVNDDGQVPVVEFGAPAADGRYLVEVRNEGNQIIHAEDHVGNLSNTETINVEFANVDRIVVRDTFNNEYAAGDTISMTRSDLLNLVATAYDSSNNILTEKFQFVWATANSSIAEVVSSGSIQQNAALTALTYGSTTLTVSVPSSNISISFRVEVSGDIIGDGDYAYQIRALSAVDEFKFLGAISGSGHPRMVYFTNVTGWADRTQLVDVVLLEKNPDGSYSEVPSQTLPDSEPALAVHVPHAIPITSDTEVALAHLYDLNSATPSNSLTVPDYTFGTDGSGNDAVLFDARTFGPYGLLWTDEGEEVDPYPGLDDILIYNQDAYLPTNEISKQEVEGFVDRDGVQDFAMKAYARAMNDQGNEYDPTDDPETTLTSVNYTWYVESGSDVVSVSTYTGAEPNGDGHIAEILPLKTGTAVIRAGIHSSTVEYDSAWFKVVVEEVQIVDGYYIRILPLTDNAKIDLLRAMLQDSNDPVVTGFPGIHELNNNVWWFDVAVIDQNGTRVDPLTTELGPIEIDIPAQAQAGNQILLAQLDDGQGGSISHMVSPSTPIAFTSTHFGAFAMVWEEDDNTDPPGPDENDNDLVSRIEIYHNNSIVTGQTLPRVLLTGDPNDVDTLDLTAIAYAENGTVVTRAWFEWSIADPTVAELVPNSSSSARTGVYPRGGGTSLIGVEAPAKTGESATASTTIHVVEAQPGTSDYDLIIDELDNAGRAALTTAMLTSSDERIRSFVDQSGWTDQVAWKNIYLVNKNDQTPAPSDLVLDSPIPVRLTNPLPGVTDSGRFLVTHLWNGTLRTETIRSTSAETIVFEADRFSPFALLWLDDDTEEPGPDTNDNDKIVSIDIYADGENVTGKTLSTNLIDGSASPIFLSVIAYDKDGGIVTRGYYTWDNRDPSVASLTPRNGSNSAVTLLPLGGGLTTLTAKAGDASASVSLSVREIQDPDPNSDYYVVIEPLDNAGQSRLTRAMLASDDGAIRNFVDASGWGDRAAWKNIYLIRKDNGNTVDSSVILPRPIEVKLPNPLSGVGDADRFVVTHLWNSTLRTETHRVSGDSGSVIFEADRFSPFALLWSEPDFVPGPDPGPDDNDNDSIVLIDIYADGELVNGQTVSTTIRDGNASPISLRVTAYGDTAREKVIWRGYYTWNSSENTVATLGDANANRSAMTLLPLSAGISTITVTAGSVTESFNLDVMEILDPDPSSNYLVAIGELSSADRARLTSAMQASSDTRVRRFLNQSGWSNRASWKNIYLIDRDTLAPAPSDLILDTPMEISLPNPAPGAEEDDWFLVTHLWNSTLRTESHRISDDRNSVIFEADRFSPFALLWSEESFIPGPDDNDNEYIVALDIYADGRLATGQTLTAVSENPSSISLQVIAYADSAKQKVISKGYYTWNNSSPGVASLTSKNGNHSLMNLLPLSTGTTVLTVTAGAVSESVKLNVDVVTVDPSNPGPGSGSTSGGSHGTSSKASGGGGGGGGGSSRSDNDISWYYDTFWQGVRQSIRDASPGDVVVANVPIYINSCPSYILEVLNGKDITLVIYWEGETIVIYGRDVFELDPLVLRYYLKDLAAIYGISRVGGISASAGGVDPINPPTGGYDGTAILSESGEVKKFTAAPVLPEEKGSEDRFNHPFVTPVVRGTPIPQSTSASAELILVIVAGVLLTILIGWMQLRNHRRRVAAGGASVAQSATMTMPAPFTLPSLPFFGRQRGEAEKSVKEPKEAVRKEAAPIAASASPAVTAVRPKRKIRVSYAVPATPTETAKSAAPATAVQQAAPVAQAAVADPVSAPVATAARPVSHPAAPKARPVSVNKYFDAIEEYRNLIKLRHEGAISPTEYDRRRARLAAVTQSAAISKAAVEARPVAPVDQGFFTIIGEQKKLLDLLKNGRITRKEYDRRKKALMILH